MRLRTKILLSYLAVAVISLVVIFASTTFVAPRNFAQMLYSMPDAVQQKSLLYTHAVLPHLKKLGLITDRTAEKYRAIGLYRALGELPTESSATKGAWETTPVSGKNWPGAAN